MYRVYAAGARRRASTSASGAGSRRCMGNDAPQDRADERACCSRCRGRRSSTTATRSGWATTSTSATATACARRCSGAPTATRASRAANPQKLYLPVDHRPRVPLRGGQRRGAAAATRRRCSWWMKRLIALRKQHRVFGRGTIEFLHPRQPAACSRSSARTRTSGVLVVANLSRFAQHVELDLARFEGDGAGRAVRPGAASPEIDRAAVLPVARAVRLLLVRARAGARPGRRRSRRRRPRSRRRARGGRCSPARAPDARAGARQYIAARRWFRGKARRQRTRRSRT